MKRRFGELVAISYVVVILCYIFAPVAALVLPSFQEGRIPAFPLEGFSLKWYREVLQDPQFGQGVWTSLKVGLVVSILSTVLGFTSAHALCRLTIRRPLAYVAIISAPAFVPLLVSGMAALMYFQRIGLSGTFWGIVAAHVCYASPFALVIIYLAYRGLDVTQEEAAANLGSSRWQRFVSIVLPQLWPGILAAAVVSFLVSWDEFVLAWFVGGFTKTLPTVIYGSLGTTLSPALNAVGTLVMISSLALFGMAAFVFHYLRRVWREA